MFWCSDDSGVVGFKDLLFATLRHVYNHELSHDSPQKAREFIYKIEKKTLMKIDSQTKGFQFSPLRKMTTTLKKLISKSEIGTPITVFRQKKHFNPYIKLFYSQMCFRSWKRSLEVHFANVLTNDSISQEENKLKYRSVFTLK